MKQNATASRDDIDAAHHADVLPAFNSPDTQFHDCRTDFHMPTLTFRRRSTNETVTYRMRCHRPRLCSFCQTIAVRRCRRVLQRIIVQHALTHAACFTLPPQEPIPHPAVAIRQLSHAMSRVFVAVNRSLRPRRLSYVWLLGAPNRAGMPHAHLLLNCAVDPVWLQRRWHHLTDAIAVDISAIRDVPSLSAYMATNYRDALQSPPYRYIRHLRFLRGSRGVRLNLRRPCRD